MNDPSPTPWLLDCTIRDGSYVVDFQWSKHDVESIVGGLAASGIPYLEIGHGLGLGASRSKSPSAISDEECVLTSVAVKGDSKIGAFFIPGIGNRDDLKAFKENGGDFVRVGTNATEYAEAFDYVEYARELGLEVAYNFMKSYAVSPYEICRSSAEMVKRGAQMIYLVDSAGGMLPKEVSRYTELLVESVEATIGFHGHNNLLMANANALAAVEAGAGIVDATLLGIGRGAGNTQTESILVVLSRAGFDLEIDPMTVSKIGEEFVSSKGQRLKGADGAELLFGYALFHDAYLKLVQQCASEFGVDIEQLILEVSKVNKMDPSEELIKSIALQLRDHAKVEIFSPKFYHRKVK